MNHALCWDLLALVWLISWWAGYAAFARRKARTTRCLLTATRYYQYQWMLQITDREVRIADATSMGVLERVISFFAGTTMLLLGGLLTMLLNGSEKAAMEALSHIPFFQPSSIGAWELKIVALISIFIYAFFKFTWSLRQLGFVLMMIGGSPLPKNDPEVRQQYAYHVARLFYLGMNSFNFGLRAYYFALGALAWFVHPGLVLLTTLWVVFVLYQREFKSKALEAMMHELEPVWQKK